MTHTVSCIIASYNLAQQSEVSVSSCSFKGLFGFIITELCILPVEFAADSMDFEVATSLVAPEFEAAD